MMVKAGRTTSLYAHSWEFWRLVAVIFSLSFIFQFILFASIEEFTEFSVCYNLLKTATAEYEVDDTIDPMTRISVSPAPSYVGNVPEFYNDAYINASSEAIQVPDVDLHTQSLPNCTCAQSQDSGGLRKAEEPRALQPLSFALYPYAKFSTYRLSLNTFFVVGLTSAVARAFDTPVYNCQWKQRGKDLVITNAEMIYIKYDENRMPFVPSIVNCTFPTAVGEDGNGGVLKLAVTIKPKRDNPTGTVTADVLYESKGAVRSFNDTLKTLERDGAASLPYKYAFCGPPMHGKIRAEWILGWLTYHYNLYEGLEGKVRFFFYNVGGLHPEGRRLLDPFIQAGVIEVIDALDEWYYPAHYHNQVMFINDCLHRTRYLAQWTLFHDFDEFLYIPPPLTLATLLQQNEDRPWMTFGSMPASWGLCTDRPEPSTNKWPVEKMVWVEKQPECRYAKMSTDPWMCTGPLGRRKYVVNPRKVLASGVHVISLDTEAGGLDLNGSVGRVHHYHGALALMNRLCGTNVSLPISADNSSDISRYVFDDAVARDITKARELLAPLLGEV